MKVNIYTDGACRGNPGKGGYGTVLEYTDASGYTHQKEFSQGYLNTTNNRMELLAVVVGLNKLKKPCDVTVYSDSKYIVDAINQGWLEGWIKNGWKRGKKKEAVKNEDIWRQMVEAMAKHNMTFQWVKGHAGHPMNERCDDLATSAADAYDLIEDVGYHGA